MGDVVDLKPDRGEPAFTIYSLPELPAYPPCRVDVTGENGEVLLSLNVDPDPNKSMVMMPVYEGREPAQIAHALQAALAMFLPR